MALVHATCFGPGTVFPIWQATDGGTLLDADDGDDTDGDTRWGVLVSPNEFAGQHASQDFRDAMCDGDTTGKIRLGVSFKFLDPGNDTDPPGVGKYVCWEEIASQITGGGTNPDKWGWGVEVTAAGNVWALFWFDNSASTWIHVVSGTAPAGAAVANTWYYVTIEFDGTNITDSTDEVANDGDAAMLVGDTTVKVLDDTLFTVNDILVLDNEKIRVTAIDAPTNVLTVVRGHFGTTAAEHADATTIYFWTPTAALYATTAAGEVNVIAAQAEPNDWANSGHGNGRYMGGWEYINIQESGKGNHNTWYRMCNGIVTDDSDPNGDGFFTSRVAWLDRVVVMGRIYNDIEKDWTPIGGSDCYGAVDDWARESGCGAVQDAISSTADDQQWLGDMVDIANVRGVILLETGQSPFYAHNTLGGDAESAVGDLAAAQTGVSIGLTTIRCHRLRETPEGNTWSDARINAFRAGLDADAGGYVCGEFGVICVGDKIGRAHV